MAKPSIFSRDYEKRMKRRKRKIILSILIIVVVIIAVVIKFEIKNIDFSNMRSKIKDKVESDRQEQLNDNKNEIKKKDNNTENNENEKEKKKEEEKKYVNLVVSDGLTVRAQYTEENGTKKIIGVDETTMQNNTSYSINPSGSNILITDSNQNILLFDVDGNKTDITKQSYTSQSGTVFQKDAIIAQNPSYIWDSQAKFIDDTTIAYVSQLPYFGDAAVNKYIWIYSITNKTENCLWNNHGTNVTLGDIVQGKGLSVNIDNVNYYVMNDGSVVQ